MSKDEYTEQMADLLKQTGAGMPLKQPIAGDHQKLLNPSSSELRAPESLQELMFVRTGIGERIRTARTALGLKQAELAEIGSIARATQVSYEAGNTEPTTAYLRSIQASGMDVPFVLSGHSSADLITLLSNGERVDWERIQRAHEDVEFFCLKAAPSCPSRYRWKMVADLYSSDLKLDNSQPPKDTMTFLSKVITNYCG
ncbi:MAG: helix-turn-helix transcriptional regulator [Polynucleobacter sp.]|nr:helix-turn-helix transcriptional regulator [Polynucleobacter sp.]